MGNANMATRDDVADLSAIKLTMLEASEKINEIISGQKQQDKILEILARWNKKANCTRLSG
jgi:hypothetical protein